jgi:SAM-dependent methyltransferase
LKLDTPPLNCACDGRAFETVFAYTAPPHGEVQFVANEGYARAVLRCAVCHHFVSVHDMPLGDLYNGLYVDSTYGEAGIQTAFERIINLPSVQSDNVGRVARVLRFAHQHLAAAGPTPSVLDVGSGLCVFLNALKKEAFECTALDPDPRAVAHARDRVGVRAVCGDFMAVDELGPFDLIAFNKVLEHVNDPVGMLAKSHRHLKPGGFVYIEVPDGEAAMRDGPGREEFFIDHQHIFSLASLDLLAMRAGFVTAQCERLFEPSTKYTLAAFMKADG